MWLNEMGFEIYTITLPVLKEVDLSYTAQVWFNEQFTINLAAPESRDKFSEISKESYIKLHKSFLS